MDAARILASVQAKVPLVTTEIAIGARTWRVTAVQNQDALLDAAEEMEHFPYGLLLWEAAVGLSRWMAARPELVVGKRVLELGTGVGLAGLVARTLGAEVWQTDHQRTALALAEANAIQNGVEGVQRFVGDWRSWTHKERYDVLLGADILYERAMHFYLEQLFERNLALGGCLLLSDPGRPQAMEFVAHLEKSGWSVELETKAVARIEDAESKPVEVALMVARRD